MFIHLGGEKIVRSSELVAIFDLTTETDFSEETFPKPFVPRKKIEKIGDEEPKSLVVTEKKLYYSPISSATLKKRATYTEEGIFIVSENEK